MFSSNQWCHLSQSLLLCFPVIFPGNANVFLRDDAGGGQRNSTLCCYSDIWKMSFISFRLDLMTVFVPKPVLKKLEATERGSERVIAETWALCQGARCPRSEPWLFTGCSPIPVRELSASELIWAAPLAALTTMIPALHGTMYPLSASLCLSLSSLVFHPPQFSAVHRLFCSILCNHHVLIP